MLQICQSRITEIAEAPEWRLFRGQIAPQKTPNG
jgi:hypothetical protein